MRIFLGSNGGNKFKDSIERSIHILDNYKGDYEVTLMINTAYIVLGQIVEYYTKIDKQDDKVNEIYDLIGKENIVIVNPNNKDKFTIIRALRNSLAHYNINTIGEVTIDKIILNDNSISFELNQGQLMNLIHEFLQLID